MEFFIWFTTILAATGGIVAFMKSVWFQNKLLPKADKQVVPAKTLAEAHAEDHAFWLAEYKAILQKDCDHLYHHQNWYTCMLCGYEEPWEYKDGCRCEIAENRMLTEVHPHYSLIKRQSFCIVHGMDFKLYPISDRKRGPYGPHHSADTRASIELSRVLTRGRSVRRIDYDIEGSN